VSGNEIEVRQPRPQSLAAALPAKVQYAKALADSGLLPKQYQGWPANVLWAMEYGEMLGLTPMAAITGVHVIEGKPSASAGLISALVRRAGHKLRVKGDSKSATCQIVRADDPDFTFEVTWTLKRNNDDNPSAEEAGLLGKNIWKNYPASMLKSRAITQCARDACEEALFGLHYTPEELGTEVDEDGVVMGGPAQAPSEPPQDAQVVETDTEWLEATLRIIPSIGLDACRKLWAETREKFRAGQLTGTDQVRVLEPLGARMEALANPAKVTVVPDAPPCEVVEAEVVDLDPEDPWAPAVEALASAEDAEILLADVADQRGRGEITPEHAAMVERAIEARFPNLRSETQVAA